MCAAEAARQLREAKARTQEVKASEQSKGMGIFEYNRWVELLLA